jgi:gluconate 2-dehydrogenase gamma chain
MNELPRRRFFRAAGAAAATLAAQSNVLAAPPDHTMPDGMTGASAPQGYLFFQPDEAAFIEAAVERLIPGDETGPGARQAGVQFFLDKQLGGAWGAGERLYRSGPWQTGTPSQGYQLPFVPAELFRTALRAIADDVKRKQGKSFAQLPASDQDAYLKSLQSGSFDLNGVPCAVFFESLLGLTIEGYFGDPVYGGNKDMASWKMIGFPGAYADYYHLVDQHGMAYTRPPVSLAQNGKGVIHIHPDIPASLK